MSKPKKLSYKHQRELDQIEEKIISAEAAVEECQEQMQKPETVSDPERLQACCEQLEECQQEVESLYQRWEELEALKNGGID